MQKGNQMASIQKQFELFHSEIRLDEDDQNAKLREKRDLLTKNLRENISNEAPSFETFNQGSYSMGTGIVPQDCNYDIDVGVTFDCEEDKYPDPVELKQLVRDALTHGNRTVAIRRPCVTVTYMKNGNPDYHVDLAIYVKRFDGLLNLAMGKESSSEDKRFWQISDPKGLTDLIKNHRSGEEAAQFRRCIRYLKRWRDVHCIGGEAPISVALTVAAYRWFSPYKDPFSGKYTDLDAMSNWCNVILSNFDLNDSLQIPLPVQPYSNLLEKMTTNQMSSFKDKLENLYEVLCAAQNEPLPEDACQKLHDEFGDDFPEIEKEESAKSVDKPYVSTGASA